MSNSSTQKQAAKQPADHPKYAEMIRAAIVALKERNGSSRQAIEKYIKANYKVGDRASLSIKAALKRGASTGQFVHTKGVGASGSFKVNKEEKGKKAAKDAVPRAKKPPADKPAKKAKKPAVKRAPAKEKSSGKTAQNAKKSAPKKVSSAKKQTSSAPKKSPVKKPSTKNSKATGKPPNKKPAGKKVSKKWKATV